MIEGMNDITNNTHRVASFGGDWFITKDLTKTLTLSELKDKLYDETQELLRMTEDHLLIISFENRLSVNEEEAYLEQVDFRPCELFIKDEEMHKILEKRRYRQRLSRSEKQYLSYLLIENPDHSEFIKRTYKLSDWMCKKLKTSRSQYACEWDEKRCGGEWLADVRNSLERTIEIMVKPPKPPTTIKRLQSSISNALGIDVEGHTISKILRKRLKYSYKRGSSRPKKWQVSSHPYLKSIFSLKLLQEVYNGRLVANIDECGFSRMVKHHYSWLPVGQGGSITNQLHTGSCNLIMSIFSNGEWFGVLKKGTTKARDYCLFLLLMIESLGACGIDVVGGLTIIQDNFAGHHSKEVKRLASTKKLKMYFLPSYTPELAGI